MVPGILGLPSGGGEPSGLPQSGRGPQLSPTAMFWRTVGFLSVTLQRQHFRVLAAGAPSLGDQVEGRLGRPLSEVPEFWRVFVLSPNKP